MKFERLQKIMNANGFSKLADIARELNISPQALNNWKLRNQVPKKFSKYILENYNTDLNTAASNEHAHNSTKDLHFLKSRIKDPNQTFRGFEEDSISLWEIIFILKANVKIIFFTPSLLCTIAIFYLLFFADPIFTSSATLIPTNNQSGSGAISGLVNQFGLTIPQTGTNKIAYREIIKSRTIAKKMIYKKFNTLKYGKDQSLLKLLTYKNKRPSVGIDTLEQLAINALQNLIKIREDIKTSIVTLNVNASEPRLAADIANALIEELNLHQKNFNSEQAAKKRIFIEERIKEVNVDLAKTEETLKEFRQRNKKYQDSPSLLLAFERLLREVEVQKQLYITLKNEFERAQIQEVEESDLLYVLDKPQVPLNRSKPQRKLIVITVGFIGLILGVISAFGKNWYKNLPQNNPKLLR